MVDPASASPSVPRTDRQGPSPPDKPLPVNPHPKALRPGSHERDPEATRPPTLTTRQPPCDTVTTVPTRHNNRIERDSMIRKTATLATAGVMLAGGVAFASTASAGGYDHSKPKCQQACKPTPKPPCPPGQPGGNGTGTGTGTGTGGNANSGSSSNATGGNAYSGSSSTAISDNTNTNTNTANAIVNYYSPTSPVTVQAPPVVVTRTVTKTVQAPPVVKTVQAAPATKTVQAAPVTRVAVPVKVANTAPAATAVPVLHAGL